MATYTEIVGVIACGSVAVRYALAAITSSPALKGYLIEGVKSMADGKLLASLQEAVKWNMIRRDSWKRTHNCAKSALVRSEASRNVRHHQRNIDQLNKQLRELDK